MDKTEKLNDWLTSKEAEKALHLDSCELMHLRVEGKLRFTKKGNAFLYTRADVDALSAKNSRSGH